MTESIVLKAGSRIGSRLWNVVTALGCGVPFGDGLGRTNATTCPKKPGFAWPQANLLTVSDTRKHSCYGSP